MSMPHQLVANTVVLLRFFVRNRLLLAFAGILAFMGSVSLIPMVFMVGPSSHFETIKDLVDMLNWFALVFIASFGLLAVSHHVGSRALKMVVTKPCRPDVWVGSLFAAAGIAAAAIHGTILLVAVVMCRVWGVTVLAGLPFMALQGFCWSMTVFAYLTLLVSLVHPVVAALLAIVVNGDVFYQIMEAAASGIRSSDHPGLFLKGAFWVGRSLYFLLPSYVPYYDETEAARSSLAVYSSDWVFLGAGASYAVVLVALCFVATTISLRRRRLA
jgi:hypothetical protein